MANSVVDRIRTLLANIAGYVPGTTSLAVDKDDDDDVHTGSVPGTPRSDESKDNDPAVLCAVGCPPTISPDSSRWRKLRYLLFENLRLKWVSHHKFFITMLNVSSGLKTYARAGERA